MTKSLRKNILREIRGTWKRFVSIALMAFLGAGFFVGINASSLDMQLSCDQYLDEQNCFDLEVLSTMGLTEDDVKAVLQVRGVEDAVGVYSENVLVDITDGDEKVKLLSIPQDSHINALYVIDGEMPDQADECVVPQSLLEVTGKQIGDTLTITETLEEEETSSFYHTELTITGVIESPLYLYSSSGTNERSTGAVADYMYVPQANIAEEYYTELYLTVDGAAELNAFEDEYESHVDDIEVLVKEIADEREAARYHQLVDDANAEIDDAQAELDEEAANARQEIADAQKKLDDAQRELDEGRRELNNSRAQAEREFAAAQDEIDSAEQQLAQGRRAFEEQSKAAESQRAELVETQQETSQQLQELRKQREETAQTIAELETQRTQLTDAMAQIQAGIEELTAQLEQAKALREQMIQAGMDITELDAQIDQMETKLIELAESHAGYELQLEQLNMGIAQAKEGLAQIDRGIAQAEDGLAQIENGIEQIDKALADGRAQLSAAQAQLTSAKRQLANARNEAYAQMNEAARELVDGQAEIDDGNIELAAQRADFDREIADAQKEIDEAREKVGDINKPTWYVLTRDGNTGLSSFNQDSSNLKRIGFTFPLIFFLVAVLISLSSMTRMVEEQRGLIGTLGALGYSSGQIAAKYLLYAAVASISGAILGELICFRALPTIVWAIYDTFYTLPAFYTPIDPIYAAAGIVICAGSIIAATAAACWKEVRRTPAHLMRPKAPNPGKRVLLERITPLWKRLSFSHKVTLRNLFRYKKRFIMTICGIAGCSMLITAGLGLRDSLQLLLPLQYEQVMHYDLIAVAGDVTQDEFTEMSEEMQADDAVRDSIAIHAESVNLVADSGKSYEIELFTPSDTENFRQYISLIDTESEQELSCGNEIMLTEQIADMLGVKAGDTVSVRREDGTKADVTIGAVVHNYLNHYAFLSAEGYETAYGETPEDNTFLVNTAELNEAETNAFVKKLNSDTRYTTVSSTADARSATDDRLGLIDGVVVILIGAAAALAVVVLYNLSNINISERIRELATIKVLGFYDREVYQYNTRETVILTILGTLLGLAGGRWLTAFVLLTMEMQGIVIVPTVNAGSYVAAAVLTVIFATVVNLSTYFSLRKINMVEALKSVE